MFISYLSIITRMINVQRAFRLLIKPVRIKKFYQYSNISTLRRNILPLTAVSSLGKTSANSKYYCSSSVNLNGTAPVDLITYETVCSETLEGLCEYFEELLDSCSHLQSPDVTYSSGVLTVNFGEPYGIYVINRQSPNRQIWLSSPISGPKRYNFIANKNQNGGVWIYKHDGKTLHQLLQLEIRNIVNKDIDFLSLPYGRSYNN